MNFNLVEMYNGLLRFNKHILNELAEGLKHLPNLDGVSKGDSLIINEQGNPAWGSTAFIPTFENAAYGIEWTKDDNDIIRIGNAKFYYRYADDIVILSNDKDFLHKVLIYIKLYIHTIGLKVKDNYQIYPVDSRGINFVGYVFYHTHTLIRKSIKYKIIRLVNSYLNREIDRKEFKIRMCAYYGWLKHANTKNLLYKIQSLTGVRYSNWDGKRTNIAKYYNKYVRIIQVINYAKYFRINFIRNGKAYYADSRDKILFYSIHRLNHFPITFKITKYDWRIYTKSKKEKVKPQT